MPKEYSDDDVLVSPKSFSDDEVTYSDDDVTIQDDAIPMSQGNAAVQDLKAKKAAGIAHMMRPNQFVPQMAVSHQPIGLGYVPSEAEMGTHAPSDQPADWGESVVAKSQPLPAKIAAPKVVPPTQINPSFTPETTDESLEGTGIKRPTYYESQPGPIIASTAGIIGNAARVGNTLAAMAIPGYKEWDDYRSANWDTGALRSIADWGENIRSKRSPDEITGEGKTLIERGEAALNQGLGMIPYMIPYAGQVGMVVDAMGKRDSALEKLGYTPSERLGVEALFAVPDAAIAYVSKFAGPAKKEVEVTLKKAVGYGVNVGLAMLAKHYGDTFVDQALGITPLSSPNEPFGSWLARAWKEGALSNAGAQIVGTLSSGNRGALESAVSGFALGAIPAVTRSIMGKISKYSMDAKGNPIELPPEPKPGQPTLGYSESGARVPQEGYDKRLESMQESLDANRFQLAQINSLKNIGKMAGRRAELIRLIEQGQKEIADHIRERATRQAATGGAIPLGTEVQGPMLPEGPQQGPELAPPRTTPELIPAKTSDVLAAGQVEPQSIITTLRENRVRLGNELEQANAERERVRLSGKRGSSQEWKEANARVARATADLVAADKELSLHTGKTYEELQGEPSGVTPEQMNEPSPGKSPEEMSWGRQETEQSRREDLQRQLEASTDPKEQARLADELDRLGGIQELNLGLNLKRLATNALGLPPETSYTDIAKAVLEKIGGLGETLGETVEKIKQHLKMGDEDAFALAHMIHGKPTEDQKATRAPRPLGEVTQAEAGAPQSENFYHVDAKGRVSNLGTEAPDSLHPGESLLAVGKDGTPRVVDSQSGLNDQQLLERVGPKVLDLNKRASDVRYLAAGLDLTPELQMVADKVKAKLGLPEGSSNADLVGWVKLNIGELGTSIKETTVKIMSKAKGIGRDLAEAIANHLHEAVSGSRESQLGAIGPDIKKEHRERFARALDNVYPGDTYYRVDRTGRVTNLGPQPDAPVRNGEAIIMVDGLTGKPQVQNSQGLGTDSAVLGRFGEKVAGVHKTSRIADNLGLQQMYEAGMAKAKEKLGLPEGSTDGDVVRAVAEKLGGLGKTAKETAVKIMNKIKGIGRDLAEAIANHLHEAVNEFKTVTGMGGDRRGRVGQEGNAPVSGFGLGSKSSRKTMAELKAEASGSKAPNQVAREKAIEGAERLGLHGQDKAGFIAREMKGEVKLPLEVAPQKSELGIKLRDNSVYRGFKELQGIFGSGVGETGESAKGSIREIASRSALADARRDAVLSKLRRPFEKLPEKLQNDLIDAYESGKKVVNFGAWDEGSTWAKNMYDKLWNEMAEVGIDNVGYVENYLTIQAKNPEQIANYLANTKKTLAGRAGFLEARNLANHAAMRAAGIEPKYTNLADIMVTSMADMQRLIKAKRILNAEVADGRVVTEPGPGLVKLPHELTSKIAGKDAEGNKLNYYATPGVATVLHNHMSSGFEGTRGRNIYHAVRTWADTSVSLQLAVNAFHFTFSMVDAQWMKGDLAISKFQQGDIKGGALEMVKAAVPGWSQYDIFKDGSKLRKALLSGDIPPELKDAAEAFVMGGARASQSEYRIDSLHSNAEASFRKAWRGVLQEKYGQAGYDALAGTIKTPIFLAELLNKPLMEELIPRMKVGAISQLCAFERSKGTDGLRKRYQEAVQTVDDRLGQMCTDNMFWDKYATQIMRILTRSLTWNLGTKNVAMGAVDPVKTIYDSFAKRELQPTSHRTNYLVGGIILTAWNSMLLQFLLTGTSPKKLDESKDEFIPGVPYSTDLFMPRIGGVDRYGKPKRVMVASYIKDMAEFVKIATGSAGVSAYKFIASKVNPGISLPLQSLANEDELGNQLGGVKERVAHAIPKPIGATQVVSGLKEGKSIPEALAPSMGFPPAKKDLVSTPAENTIREKINMRRARGTAEEFKEAVKQGQLAEATHATGDEELRKLLDEGDISRYQYQQIKKNSKEKAYLAVAVKNRNLKFDDLYDVYKAANSDADKKLVYPKLLEKFSSERFKVSPENRKEMEEKFAEINKLRAAK